MPTEPSHPSRLGCLLHVARSVLLVVGLLALALGGIEAWERWWAWPVDPSWYRVEEAGGDVRVYCQDFQPVHFTSRPAQGVTRILAVGGSTTFGYPDHPVGTSDVARPGPGFVGVMQGALDARWPGAYELINLGINGGNSVDTLRMVRRAKDWGASGLVIYDGHNEFISMPARYAAGLWRSALYRHVMLLAPRVRDSPGWIGPPASPTPKHTRAVLELFRANLDAMVDAAGLPTVIATQASNLGGMDPNWSTVGTLDELRGIDGLSNSELRDRWHADRRFADLAWAVGQRQRARGLFAQVYLRAAADNDGLTLRATSAMNGVIRDVAEAQHAAVAEAEWAVQADGSVPDYDLYYDWVHPRPEAARRIAGEVLGGLVTAGVIPERPAVAALRADSLAEVRSARSWLQWACVRGHDPAWRLGLARRHAREALRLNPGDPEATAVLGIADALEGKPSVLPADPALRLRLAALHPRIAAVLGVDHL